MLSTGICRWLFLLISLSTWTRLIDSKEMRIVCYYTNWSVYRPGQAKFSPQNINPYLCTHLVYAFGGFTKENTLKPFDKYQDIEKGGYAKFIGLKTYNKNLKTLIAIGGWNEGSSRFSPMVASAERRKELVKNSIKFLRQNHFDGLDLDWEYPTFRDGGKPRDKDNYAQLVKELREEFERESEKTGRPRLLLTMAVPAGIEYINKGYDVPKLTKYLDWMNILSYDYHSAFEPAVNHHAPLYSLEEDNEYNYDGELNIDYTIKHYLKLGADPNKLVLGIPTYGRSYTLFNPDAYEIGSPADGPGDMGEATRENGYLAYYEICEYIKDQDWEVEEPNSNAMGPVAFKGNQWVGYDDENIVRKKSEYVAENSLGGIMFWAIDNDDFRGNCHGRPYPLIEAAKEALINAYGLTEDNLISPPSKSTKSSKQKSRNRTRKTTTSTTTEEPEEISASTSSSSRRRRIKSKSKSEDRSLSSPVQKRRKDTNRKAESSTYSSLKVITPAYTTPAPPATPDMGGAFKCEDEGFFPHPKDCKKYFWCLGGAGDTGIVAHQFTCPAGLFFNKAADSCDYSQNVLCNKKLQKSTSSTTEKLDSSTESSSSEKPTPSSILFSTSRVPPKITAATSKTSFFRSTTSTTTEAYDDEYEEYDDEDEVKPEEDPKVIKELIDLIKKAGGIEELEKQLKFGKDSSSQSLTPDSTTPSAISKSLVERVLSRSKNTLNALRKTPQNRNSGGPQGGDSSEEKKEKKIERGRPQYKTLTRQRPTTEKSAEKEDSLEEPVEEEKVKEKKLFRNKSSLEYVNIRRPKTSSTTEVSDDDEFSRNKILGETDDEQDDEPEDSEEVTRKNSTPQYVNIRRTRPSTTEGTSSSKYASIRRSTISPVEEDEESNEAGEESKYKIRRGSTTESNTILDNQTSKYQTIRRGTTTVSTTLDDEIESIRRKSTADATSTDESANSKYMSTTPLAADENDENTSKYQTIRRGSTTPLASTSELPRSTLLSKKEEANSSTESDLPVTTLLQETPSSISSQATENLVSSTHKLTTESNSDVPSSSLATSSVIPTEISELVTEKKRPVLFQPRPFSVGTDSTAKPTTESTTLTSKVSQSNLRFRLRQTTSPTTTSEPVNTTVRSRGRSRISNINKNLNEDREQEEKYERTEENKPARTRKRLLVTTEKAIDNNEEYNRAYRPAELADLSSLTAADLNLRGGEFVSSHRRRRPVTSTITTTDQPLNEFDRTASRTLPVVRKLIDPTTFGRSRRIVSKNEDQNNASSDQASSTRKIVRRFRSTTPKTVTEETEPKESKRITEESVRATHPGKGFRRIRPASSASAANVSTLSEESSVTSTTARTSTLIRRRIPIFRQRQTKNEIQVNNTLNKNKELAVGNNTTSENPLLGLFKTQSRFKIPKNDGANDDDEDSSSDHTDVLNGEEGENIKLSESNIRESSQINTFGLDEKPGRRFSKLNLGKSDIFIKPTEQQKEELTFGSKLEKTTEIEEIVETTTEPHNEISRTSPARISRTRKIVRKLSTTTEPTTTTEKLSPRRLSILRRPQPTNVTKEEAKTNDTNTKGRKYFNIRRGTTESATFSPETTSEKVEEVRLRRVFRPNFSKITTEQSSFKNEQTSSERNRFLLSRETTSTELPSVSIVKDLPQIFSVIKDDEDVNENDNDENSDDDNDENNDDYNDENNDHNDYDGNDEEGGQEFNDDDSEDTPRYTIYTTSSVKRTHKFESNINFDDEDEEDIDNGLKANKSVSSLIHTTAINSRNESETMRNEDEGFSTGKYDENKLDNKNITDHKEKTETSTKRNSLFHYQKERPAISRQKLSFSKEEIQKKSQKDVLKSNPVYRLRSTTTSSVIFTSASSTSVPLNEGVQKVESDVNDSLELDTKTHTVEIATEELVEENKKTTFAPILETTESNDITTLKINEEDAKIDETTTEELQESTLGLITKNPIDFKRTNEIGETTVYSDLEETATTIDSAPNKILINEISNEPSQSDQSVTQNAEGVTDNILSNFTESTTEYQRRSTLRSVKERPKLGSFQRTSSISSTTTNPSIEVSSRKTYTRTNLFSKNRTKPSLTGRSTEKPVTSPAIHATTPLSVNRNLYKYSAIPKNKFKSDDINHDHLDFDEEEEEQNNEDIDEEDVDVKVAQIQENTNPLKHFRTVNKPVDIQISKNSPSKFIQFLNNSASPTGNLGIDTEAVKNRNKNLFSKRKMNTPYKTPALTNSVIKTEDSSSSEAPSSVESEFTTVPSGVQTESTDPNLTTLHHIFAELDGTDTTTESMSFTPSTNPGKVERLIEVNRIVEFKTKQAKVNNHSGSFEVATKVEIVPTIDKIGEISRVTLIKIVDGNNETFIKDPDSNEIGTTIDSSSPSPVYSHEEMKAPSEVAMVEEIPASEVMQNVNLKNIELNVRIDNRELPQREDRKYEIFGESKVSDNKVLSSVEGKPEIIDGISHINIITPKSSALETSTISLQGLFQTEKAHLNPGFTTNDEVLETGPSEFVNVRVLDQDRSVRADNGIIGNTNFIPVRVLRQDEEEVTMKAHVVEIKPKPNARTIKIVPIQVEMSRNLANIRLPNKSSVKT